LTKKPLYENVGIGTIIKRIGECTALTGDYDLSIRLTQQTPREDECKDLCVTVGSKIVIIDFKAPDEISDAERVYRNVRTRINGLKSILKSNNLLLGLLHATLRVPPAAGQTSGYFLHIATPMTTIFIPLSEFGRHARPYSLVAKLGDIRIRNIKYYCFPCEGILYDIMSSEKDLVMEASVPSCYKYLYLLNNINKLCYNHSIFYEICRPACIKAVCSNCCLSCGGLCNVTLIWKYR